MIFLGFEKGISFGCLVITWDSQNSPQSFSSSFFEWWRCSLFVSVLWTVPFYLCLLNSQNFVSSLVDLCCLLPCHWNVKPTQYWHFCIPFIYCLFIEQYLHIISVWTCLCILVNTSCIYIKYVLNIPICVNELVFLSIYSVLVYHWIY